jgi:hypothetical protein
MMYEDKRVFFHAGDLVQLKQDLPNKPIMMVVKIPKIKINEENNKFTKPVLLGVTCCWFTVTGEYQEKTFNTKDLEKKNN